jgi:hypothetical protein
MRRDGGIARNAPMSASQPEYVFVDPRKSNTVVHKLSHFQERKVNLQVGEIADVVPVAVGICGIRLHYYTVSDDYPADMKVCEGCWNPERDDPFRAQAYRVRHREETEAINKLLKGGLKDFIRKNKG